MATDKDALNYPYIRVRDVNWLKRTLLLFPHVVRMTPEYGSPDDDPEVAEFAVVEGRRGPLLKRADLGSWNVHKAQNDLVKALQVRLGQDHFLSTYGRKGTLNASESLVREAGTLWKDRLLGMPFQLHSSKVLYSLQDFLLRHELAWIPQDPHGPNYIEMHPKLGQAVMATLAFACADDDRLQLVTEFPHLYERTIRSNRETLLDQILSQSSDDQPTSDNDPTLPQLAEFIVYQRCNPTKLTAERLQALNKEWEAVAAFRENVEEIAKSIPAQIKNPKTLRLRLENAANDLFKKWERDQANLSAYVRELFGDEFLSEPIKALGKIAEKTYGESVASTAIVGHVSQDYLLGAGAGCAVGLVFHAARSYGAIKKRERNSPFRYLTMMQDAGVGFVVSA
jgi:hypothetical protein